MNLSTARSANRAREVGVRKTLGAPRIYLIAQFLSESVIITLSAAMIAVFTAWALLPLFSQISGRQLTITVQGWLWLLPSLFLTVIIVGVLAGSYPAFFLSAFQPVNTLKGKHSAGFKSNNFRSFLVVLQFSISVFLIIGTLVIYNQLQYIQNKDLGFNRTHVLSIKNAVAADHPLILKQEIKQLPGVTNATLSNFLPVNESKSNTIVSSLHIKGVFTAFWTVDENYLNTMGMKLQAGRDFSLQMPTDSSAMLINETAATMLGYTPQTAINNTLSVIQGKDKQQFRIIGVIKDFNFTSLRNNVTPLVMIMKPDWRASLNVRVSTQNLPQLLKLIENKWQKFVPNEHFEYSFLDKDFDALYRTEQRLGQMFIVFTSLAIIIACLGLFGLAAFAVEQRNKELSIRKILGASASRLIVILSTDFMKLVVVAILIAAPFSWFIMNKWLQGFAYRQDIPWWIFGCSAFGALFIAFITVSFQFIKASLVNPVISLREN